MKAEYVQEIMFLFNTNSFQYYRFGKASYVESVTSVGKMDAGAYGVALWFNAIHTAYIDAIKH